MNFEENLRELRKQKGFSQEELAEQLSVSRQAVSKWENGSGYPELDKLMSLCELFHCTMDELLKGDVRERDVVGIQKYENHYHMMAKSSAFAVFMIMMGLISGAFLEPYFTGKNENVLGVLFFIFIAIGVMTFIYYGMQAESFRKKYPKIPQGIYAEDIIDDFERKYRISTVVGVGIILLSFAIQVLLDHITAENIANGTWMFMIGIATTIFVYYGTLKTKISETLPKTEAELAKAKEDSRVGKWCGCIMIVGVIIYLTWSFVSNDWGLTWIVFPIAGLLCGIVAIVCSKEE